jgi:hypothetical protein
MFRSNLGKVSVVNFNLKFKDLFGDTEENNEKAEDSKLSFEFRPF